jgi:DNA-binding MarR family transcriptional regulator
VPLALPREREDTGGLWPTPKRMKPKRIGDLPDRIGCLGHPCDLDLLLFFYRHPKAYLQSERLAEYVGYDLPQVERSLETLMTAGLLRQSPDSTGPARLYVLTRSGSPLGGWLSSLLQIAATREGRLAVIHALKQRRSPGLTGGSEPEPVANVRPRPRTLEEPHA